LRDAGYIGAKAYRVTSNLFDATKLKIKIGFKDDHYYIFDKDNPPQIVFLTKEEQYSDYKFLRPLTISEVKEIRGGKGGSRGKGESILSSVLSFTPLAPIAMAYNLYRGIESGDPLQIVSSAAGLGGTLGSAVGVGDTMTSALKTVGRTANVARSIRDEDYMDAALNVYGGLKSATDWYNAAKANNVSNLTGVAPDNLEMPDTSLKSAFREYQATQGQTPQSYATRQFNKIIYGQPTFNTLGEAAGITTSNVNVPAAQQVGLKLTPEKLSSYQKTPQTIAGKVGSFFERTLKNVTGGKTQGLEEYAPLLMQFASAAVPTPQVPDLQATLGEYYNRLLAGGGTVSKLGQTAQEELRKYIETGGEENFEAAYNAAVQQLRENYDRQREELKNRYIKAGGYTSAEGYSGQYFKELDRLNQQQAQDEANLKAVMKDAYMQRHLAAIGQALNLEADTTAKLLQAASQLGLGEQVKYALKLRDTESLRQVLANAGMLWEGFNPFSKERYVRVVKFKDGSKIVLDASGDLLENLTKMGYDPSQVEKIANWTYGAYQQATPEQIQEALANF